MCHVYVDEAADLAMAEEIAFNAKYLMEYLSVVDTEGIRMELTGPLSAGVIKQVGKDDYLYVVMPMQIM
mgnify:CR=1 FL=1